jgi:hypothetical protein
MAADPRTLVEEFVAMLERLRGGEVMVPRVLNARWYPIQRIARDASPDIERGLSLSISRRDWDTAIAQCRALLDSSLGSG